MNVILDSMIVARMPIVATLKEVIIANVRSPFLVMERHAQVSMQP